MPRIGVFAVFLFKLVLIISLLPMCNAQAAVYYVDQKNPAASDANPGTEVAPWLSLSPIKQVKLLPGDTVLVKEGIYRESANAENDQAMIDLHESGEPGKPIIFKSSPAFAATLEGGSQLLAAVQITHQSHIAIEGFRIVNPGKNGILIKGEINKPNDGIAIRNNILIYEQTENSADVSDGIHVEDAINIVIDNNSITNTNKNSRSTAHTGIHLGNVTNPLVEYNEIDNMSNGIRISNNAVNTKVGKNIISNTLQSIQVNSEPNAIIRQLSIANNVFTTSEVAISLWPDGGIIRKIFVNNNVINDYSVAALQIVQPGMGKTSIWNNIFKRGEQGKTFIGDVFTYDDPPLSIARMDYNLFAEQPLFITGLYSTNRRLSSLDVWRGFAEQDAHSVVNVVEFRDPTRNDFRLAKQSRKVIKGTVDGKPSSRRVEVGAYTTAIKQIGVTRQQAPEQDVTKVATTSTVAIKPKATQTKQSEASKPGPVKMSRLEWEVDRQLQFGGKCVLESNKVDFFDGYDNTGLKFRVLDNELFLLTKSNIDMSFNDVGLQVGSNEFLHADNVVLDQNVVITKEMPKLLTQLRKSSETRVQLRFWPSYPATKAYSQLVALDGFLPAYQVYQDCQRGN